MHDAISQPSRESVGTRVLRKIDGRWRVVATQNTDVRPGRRHDIAWDRSGRAREASSPHRSPAGGVR